MKRNRKQDRYDHLPVVTIPNWLLIIMLAGGTVVWIVLGSAVYELITNK